MISFPAVRPKQQTDRNDDHDAAIDRPLWIAGHITSRQHVDSLQEERDAGKDQDDTYTIQYQFHEVRFDKLILLLLVGL